MRVRSLVAGSAAIILGLGLAPAASALHPSQPTMTSSAPTAQVGSSIYLSSNEACRGAAANGTSQIIITLNGQKVASDAVSSDGSWMVTVDVPDETGVYTYEASCTAPGGAVSYAPQTITVLPPPPPNLTAVVGEVTREDCTVSIPVTTTGNYFFDIEVWDDQKRLENIVWETTADGTTVLNWTITGRPDPTFPGDIYFDVRVNGSVNINEAEQRANGTVSYPEEVADACSARVPVTASLQSETATLTPGQKVTIAGTGLVYGEAVDVTLEGSGTRVGGQEAFTYGSTTSTTDPFSVEAVLPADLPAGEHVLVLKGQDSQRSTRIPITVAPGSQS